MGFDGSRTNKQLRGDFLARAAESDEAKDLLFPRAKQHPDVMLLALREFFVRERLDPHAFRRKKLLSAADPVDRDQKIAPRVGFLHETLCSGPERVPQPLLGGKSRA